MGDPDPVGVAQDPHRAYVLSMGQVSGHAARSWHRRRRDQRLGYSALGLGAGGFVLVLAGTLLVTEVVPGILNDGVPAQRVEPASELSPVRAPEPAAPDAAPDAAPARSVTAIEGPATVPVVGPGPSGGTDQPPASTPETPGDPAIPDPEPPAGPGPDTDPEPQPEGRVGATIDRVVQGVTDVAGGATGGVTTPVTTPVVDVVDAVTDVVDGLLR